MEILLDMKTKKRYYDLEPLLDGEFKHYPVKIVVGGRGVGKTFGVINEEMLICLKTGVPMVYIVENNEHIKELYNDCYSGLINNFTAVETEKYKEVYDRWSRGEITFEGKNIYLDGQLMIYVMALSAFAKYKKLKYLQVSSMLFEEFLPEAAGLVQNRIPKQFLSIVQTVLRTNKCNIWLLGNIATLYKTYNIAFAIGFNNIKTYGYHVLEVNKKPLAVMHLVEPNEYEIDKEKEDSLAGMLAAQIDETQDKNLLYDNPLFVDEFPQGKFKEQFNVVFDDYHIGFFTVDELWYATSRKIFPKAKSYGGERILKGLKRLPVNLRDWIKRNYNQNQIRFIDMNVEALIVSAI